MRQDNSSSEHLMGHPSFARALLTNDGILVKDQEIFNTNSPGSVLFCITSCIPTLAPSSISQEKPIITYKSIIWCEKFTQAENFNLNGEDTDNLIQVTYCSGSEAHITPKSIILLIDKSCISLNEDLSNKILNKAYRSMKFSKSILVIINPHGGQGKASSLYDTKVKPILQQAHCKVDYMETKYYQHALDIIADIDINEYDIIACCSGDGIPHEVINALYKRKDRVDCFNKLIVTQLPCGSGNAMAESCLGTNEPSNATLTMLKSEPVKMDLMCCIQGTGAKRTTKLSFLTQTFGIIADSDIGTEYLRFLGAARFDIGVLLRVLARSSYPCELYVKYITKNKDDLFTHYNKHKSIDPNVSAESIYSKSASVLQQLTESNFHLNYPNLGENIPNDWEMIDKNITNSTGVFYTGKMPYISNNVLFFPAALPNDGAMDLVITDSRTSISKTVSIFLTLEKGKHVLHEAVQHSKISAYRLIPKTSSGYLSVDGESFPFEPLQVEILPGLLTTLLKDGEFTSVDFKNK